VDTATARQCDVAPDGRFMINTVLDAAGVVAQRLPKVAVAPLAAGANN